MEEKIKKIIVDLEYEREQYGDRIVSLHYGYDSALEKLHALLGTEFNPYES